jgi:VIT1/CCC1 family predicted Fe2+/Mn2+ transporter
MEKFVLLSLAFCLSVVFYVVTYFLITWQWPQTILSMSVCALVLFFLIEEIDHSQGVKPVDWISTVVTGLRTYMLSGDDMVNAGNPDASPPSSPA